MTPSTLKALEMLTRASFFRLCRAALRLSPAALRAALQMIMRASFLRLGRAAPQAALEKRDTMLRDCLLWGITSLSKFCNRLCKRFFAARQSLHRQACLLRYATYKYNGPCNARVQGFFLPFKEGKGLILRIEKITLLYSDTQTFILPPTTNTYRNTYAPHITLYRNDEHNGTFSYARNFTLREIETFDCFLANYWWKNTNSNHEVEDLQQIVVLWNNFPVMRGSEYCLEVLGHEDVLLHRAMHHISINANPLLPTLPASKNKYIFNDDIFAFRPEAPEKIELDDWGDSGSFAQ